MSATGCFLRALRGATVAKANTTQAIISATRELLVEMQKANGIHPEDIISIFFTASPDLNAAYPAAAARELGWKLVPLMCASEIDVPGGLRRCIRVLMHVNTDRSSSELRHIYLGGAGVLRPDL